MKKSYWWFRPAVFFSFILVGTAFPIYILFGGRASLLGMAMGVSFLVYLYFKANHTLPHLLRIHPLNESSRYAEYLVRELCRRYQIVAVPSVRIFNDASPNLLLYGLSPTRPILAIASSVFESLSREEIGALLDAQVVRIISRKYVAHTWLAVFLQTVQSALLPAARPKLGLKSYTILEIARNCLLTPLLVFPYRLLFSTVTDEPMRPSPTIPLMEARRKIIFSSKSASHRFPFCVHHLFFCPLETREPMMRLLFQRQPNADASLKMPLQTWKGAHAP